MSVSLTMIVKNEEANLPACLGSAADLMDEVIIVDTGSTDRTKEVAARFGAKVKIFDFPWCDSFSAAFNEALRHATGQWAFRLDADESIDADNRERLRNLFADLKDENVAYLMRTVNPAVFDHIRLFRNQPGVRWEYRIHEQVLPSLMRLGHVVRRANIEVRHTGYQDPALRLRKHERDLRLLHLEGSERPDDPFMLFKLGWTYLELGRVSEAASYLGRSHQLSQPGLSFLSNLYVLLTRAYRQLGQAPRASAICAEGLSRFPDDPELLYEQAWLFHAAGDHAKTEENLLRVLRGPAQPSDRIVISGDPGLRGYITRHNLAVLYRDQNRQPEAEAHWRAVVAERPDFHPAWLGLGELYVAQGRRAELDEVLAHLQSRPETWLEAAVLKAQKHLSAREFAAARSLLETTIARAPRALGPRIVLCRVLTQEGRDPIAAGKACRDVLALDPNNNEAHANLAWIQQNW